MLVVSPIQTEPPREKDDKQIKEEEFEQSGDFPDFSDGNLLETIDFDDLFLGMDDGDVLPDLEMDPELLAELSASGSGSGDDSDGVTNTCLTVAAAEGDDEDKTSGSGTGSVTAGRSEEFASKLEEPVAVNSSSKDCEKSSKNNHGKRKVKVDWTPELHRRFVQAVEQLGVEKAVPSRILEIMGIDCLTRHNIASHLQKYRSHRKHLLAREAEAARWTHMRQIYGGGKRGMSPWLPPTMGFPPVTPMHHHFRPLHVWGHPPVDQSMLHIWPKHLVPLSPSTPQASPWGPSPPPPSTPQASPWGPSPPPPSTPQASPWGPSPPPPPMDPSYWSHHAVCYPQPIPPPTRYAAPAVPGILPHPMYKVDAGIGVPTGNHVLDFQPSTETIDAVIGDVISKPWLPLPLGLKPPSVDGVLGELHRQGVPKIPPSCS